jgi:limonene-1,2-epoxide hydrolase
MPYILTQTDYLNPGKIIGSYASREEAIAALDTMHDIVSFDFDDENDAADAAAIVNHSLEIFTIEKAR